MFERMGCLHQEVQIENTTKIHVDAHCASIGRIFRFQLELIPRKILAFCLHAIFLLWQPNSLHRARLHGHQLRMKRNHPNHIW